MSPLKIILCSVSTLLEEAFAKLLLYPWALPTDQTTRFEFQLQIIKQVVRMNAMKF